MKRGGLYSRIDSISCLSWNDSVMSGLAFKNRLKDAVRKSSAGIIVPVVMTARSTLRPIHIEDLMSVIKDKYFT